MFFSSWLRNWKRSASTARRRTRKSPRQRASFRPRLEALEDRCLPSFLAPVDYPASLVSNWETVSAAAGDFANNGIQDLVVGSDGLSVLMGNGDGTFQPAQNYGGGNPYIASVAVGDLNGDGDLDIVTANDDGYYFSNNTVNVLLGNGDGTFQAPITFELPYYSSGLPKSVALGDMNHDGRLDAVVAGATLGYNTPSYDYVDILLGNGEGAFSLGSATLVGQNGGASVALGDFNGDKQLDVAAVAGQNVAILSGNGDGTLAAPTYLPTAANDDLASVTVGDINGDRKPDIVASGFLQYPSTTNGVVSVLLGNGNGSFQASENTVLPAWYPPGYSGAAALAQLATGAAVADLNGDGKMDLAVTAESGSYRSADILLGNGQGSFADAQIVSLDSDGLGGLRPYSPVAADFNGDRYPDLAVPNANLYGLRGSVSVLLNAGSPGVQASSFSVSGFPSSTAAGAAGSFTVKALDANGTVDTGYTGTVTFTSSDGQADLPATYTFTAADKGVHTFKAALKTAGTQSITVTDALSPNVTGSQKVTVTPAAASQFAVSAPASSTAGAPFSVTVTALDPYNNTATGYTGTVQFASSDGQASLPGNYTFTSGDGGVRTFSSSVTLKTAGNQTVTATDTGNTAITGGAAVSVNGATAMTMSISGFPSSVTAGVAGSFTVTLKDEYGNVATGYTGTVTFTSSDPQASLPASYTFTAGSADAVTFSATLKTAGTQSITVASGSFTATEGGITVNPAAASKFVLSAPASVAAGASFDVTVTVEDAYGNVVTGYTGTIHFSSSDNRAVLPADYTFTAGDAGVHTFTGLVLKKTGYQTITVTDTRYYNFTSTTEIDVLAAVTSGGSGHGKKGH